VDIDSHSLIFSNGFPFFCALDRDNQVDRNPAEAAGVD
jgi:hypothetical protein